MVWLLGTELPFCPLPGAVITAIRADERPAAPGAQPRDCDFSGCVLREAEPELCLTNSRAAPSRRDLLLQEMAQRGVTTQGSD